MTTQLRYEDDENGLFTNKSTMMANFEEWIKMATDNKINSRNSWNFALIDYFHDLNVLKDAEDNINFQKASATLDGCVKIYSHRVDSVATETGKLLSGLADSKRNKRGVVGTGDNNIDNADSAAAEQSEHDDSILIDPLTGLPVAKDDPETLAKKKRTYNRVLETTLVDFESIRIKDLDQNLNIDPLFKKALADFDEGGAKSLLVNTLDVDENLRIVFDATPNDLEKDKLRSTTTNSNHDTCSGVAESADVNEMRSSESKINEISDIQEDEKSPSSKETSFLGDRNLGIVDEDDILALGINFVDFKIIEATSLCPSMEQLLNAVADIEKAKSFIENVNEKSNKFLTEKELEAINNISVVEADYDESIGQTVHSGIFEENGLMDDDINGYNNNEEHALNNCAINETDGLEEAEKSGVTSTYMDEKLLAYFDIAMAKNWRGREHWKVQSIKTKFIEGLQSNTVPEESELQKNVEIPEKKISKSHFEINFFDFKDEDEERLYSSKRGTSIELPLKQRVNNSHYLLPNDYKFSTDKITRLFIKPQQAMSFFSNRRRTKDKSILPPQAEATEVLETTGNLQVADEHFWAENYQLNEQDRMLPPEEETPRNGSQEVFQEEDDGIDFNQAFEDEDLDGDMKDDFYNTQGILQNNKVTYSKTSKKVDVRKLKRNIWNSIQNKLHALVEEHQQNPDQVNNTLTEKSQDINEQHSILQPQERYALKFTDVAKDIVSMYSSTARKDLSTSFCFICLLHLANEHGFTIKDANNYHDLEIEIPENIIKSILETR